jgi:hypothetical protein
MAARSVVSITTSMIEAAPLQASREVTSLALLFGDPNTLDMSAIPLPTEIIGKASSECGGPDARRDSASGEDRTFHDDGDRVLDTHDADDLQNETGDEMGLLQENEGSQYVRDPRIPNMEPPTLTDRRYRHPTPSARTPRKSIAHTPAMPHDRPLNSSVGRETHGDTHHEPHLLTLNHHHRSLHGSRARADEGFPVHPPVISHAANSERERNAAMVVRCSPVPAPIPHDDEDGMSVVSALSDLGMSDYQRTADAHDHERLIETISKLAHRLKERLPDSWKKQSKQALEYTLRHLQQKRERRRKIDMGLGLFSVSVDAIQHIALAAKNYVGDMSGLHDVFVDGIREDIEDDLDRVIATSTIGADVDDPRSRIQNTLWERTLKFGVMKLGNVLDAAVDRTMDDNPFSARTPAEITASERNEITQDFAALMPDDDDDDGLEVPCQPPPAAQPLSMSNPMYRAPSNTSNTAAPRAADLAGAPPASVLRDQSHSELMEVMDTIQLQRKSLEDFQRLQVQMQDTLQQNTRMMTQQINTLREEISSLNTQREFQQRQLQDLQSARIRLEMAAGSTRPRNPAATYLDASNAVLPTAAVSKSTAAALHIEPSNALADAHSQRGIVTPQGGSSSPPSMLSTSPRSHDMARGKHPPSITTIPVAHVLSTPTAAETAEHAHDQPLTVDSDDDLTSLGFGTIIMGE